MFWQVIGILFLIIAFLIVISETIKTLIEFVKNDDR